MKHIGLIIFLLCSSTLFGEAPKNLKTSTVVKPPYLSACVSGSSQIDLKINNVRARLLMGGDMWWDGKGTPKYIVPNVNLGQKEVSSIFAGGIWVGGTDALGNIKLATTTYRTMGTDFWPGPLEEIEGVTSDTICTNWDRFFEVYSKDIDLHLQLYTSSIKNGTKYSIEEVPDNVKYWPAKNNPYFSKKYLFELPKFNAGLAPFFDRDGDDQYDPLKGDYPNLPISCSPVSRYADQMIFSIINDNGNIHSNSEGSEPLQLEIQKVAFSFLTNDDINNTTFYYNKLINRATTLLKDAYFSIWMDPDLGCPTDDYVGCDTSRNLMFVYNTDAQDGTTGCSCGNTNTYCDQIPMVGCTMLSGPLVFIYDPITGAPVDTSRAGMSSFTVYVNGGGIFGQVGSDPSTASEYYNYMTGRWKDGSSKKQFAYPGEPCNPNAWSMVTDNLPGQDFRTLQSTGPMVFLPGQSNEITFAVVSAENVPHPAPCLDQIRAAADKARSLSDNCFQLIKGPDAPELTITPADRSLRFSFSNGAQSNNYLLGYQEEPAGLPNNATDTLYRFEGYKVYQLKDESVSPFQLADSSKARLVFQCDLKNNITNLTNWSKQYNAAQQKYDYFPKEMIESQASNNGIPQSFVLTKDVFTEETLRNYQTYFYCAVAYGHNNYKTFDETTGMGQAEPYIQSSRRKVVTSGRPNYQNSILFSTAQPLVTRLEGAGTGNSVLAIERNMRDSIQSNTNQGRVQYKPNGSPVKILVLDPLLSQNKNFELTIFDENMSDTVIDQTARWKLKNLNQPQDSIISSNTISQFNEQIIQQYGFAISVNQASGPGSAVFTDQKNGFAGMRQLYSSYPFNWLNTVNNGSVATVAGAFTAPHLRFMSTTDQTLPDFLLDPYQSYSKDRNLFYPYALADFRAKMNGLTNIHYNTPSYYLETTFGPISRSSISSLNNVDIVLTPDKSKWSRCVVVEMADGFYTNKTNPNNPLTANYLGLETVRNPAGKFPARFDLRGDLSVGKSDADGDGRPDPDGKLDNSGVPMYGMGWFPGYAIDVETGKRLNIFFGENSCYRSELDAICPPAYQNGADMLWNPNDKIVIDDLYTSNPNNPYSHYAGGQHNIFVQNTEYDENEKLRNSFASNNKSRKATELRNTTWVTLPIMLASKQLKPLGNGGKGLIPSEVVVEMRVDQPFTEATVKGYNHGYPTYLLNFQKVRTEWKDDESGNPKTDGMKVSLSPNPYSITAHTDLQITNTDSKASTITIYALDGTTVDQFESTGQLTTRNLSDASRRKLTKGVYLVQIQEGTKASKVVKLVMME